MEKKLLMRNEVPVELTWDLSLIYKTEDEYNAAMEQMISIAKEIKDNYPGTLSGPKRINDCLELYKQINEILVLTSSYAQLAVEVDYYDTAAQSRAGKFESIVSNISSDLSFIDSEISQQSEETLNAAIKIAGDCKNYLKEIIRKKPHMLHKEAERVLSAVSQSFNNPYAVYNNLKLADMKFDDFTADGKKYPLGYSLYEDNYEYEVNTEVRRAAHTAFYNKLRQYENGTAAAYNSYCQHEKIISELRGFNNTFEKDLFEDHVTLELYHRQIDVIMEKLAPHMRKYAKLLQRVHKLDKMTYADLKLAVDPGYCPSVTIEESKNYIINGLSILGEDYVSMIKEAYANRWVDFAQNQGKCTGGFCASPYGKGSFILLSWNEKMSDVFTLAHELGHAGHFRLCNGAQSIFDTNVSGYFVEAPSTMNEMIMSNYLLKTNDDIRFRRWVLSNMVGKTYYHNFVTHLLEAAFQRDVYNLVSEGESVNAEILNQLFRSTLTKFWGDAVELTDGAELTWMRQPHYYMGLYSYSYSAGLTIATEMCKRIEKEGQSAIEDWKNVLRAGSTLDAIGLAKLGGIDITTDEALNDTIETIGSYIDEIIKLTDELDA